MIFSQIYGEIARRLADVTTETTTAIKLAINNYYMELWSKNLWWFARREYTFDTVPPYTTGTITATTDSATITGSGTTAFTQLMVGQKLVVSGDDIAYTIKTYTSAHVIVLDTVYKGTGGSGLSYGIYTSIYRLDDRAMKILWAKQTYSGYVLKPIPERKFDIANTTPYLSDDVATYTPRGQTTTPYYNTGTVTTSYYSSGTVTVTQNSATVTGSSTTFTSAMIGMVFRIANDPNNYVITAVGSTTSLTLNKVYGDVGSSGLSYTIAGTTITGSGTTFTSAMVGMTFRVIGDDTEYTISAVGSTTSLTLSEAYGGVAGATQSYAIGGAGTEQIELDPLPSRIEQIKYKAQLRPLKLIDDNDVPELPEQWHWLLIEGGFLAVASGRVPQDRIATAQNKVDRGEASIMKWHNVDEDIPPDFDQSNTMAINARSWNDKFLI